MHLPGVACVAPQCVLPHGLALPAQQLTQRPAGCSQGDQSLDGEMQHYGI